MKNYIKIFIFLILVIFSCSRSNSDDRREFTPSNSTLNEELQVLKSKPYDSLVRNEYIKLSEKYFYTNSNDYYVISKMYEETALTAKDTLGLINAKANLGLYYLDKFKIDSSYSFFSKAEKLSSKLQDKPFMVSILLNKSNILWLKKNYSEAESEAFEALNIAQDKKYYDYEFNCYIIIANTLIERNKSEKAIEYYNRALSIAVSNKETFEPSSIPLTFSYIAAAYQKQNNHKKAIEFANKGLASKSLRNNNIKVYCYLKNTLGELIYKTQKKQALYIYTETLKIGDSINFAPIQVTSQLQLGDYYLFYKDTIKATRYFQKAKILAHQNKLFEDELIILKLLSKSNTKNSQYYSDRYIYLNDSLQAVERATRDKFARIEFETDEISNQKDVIELKNKKLNTQLLLAIGFALFLLLSLYLWFRNKSNKAKIAELRLLQEKQELQNNKLLLVQEQQAKDEKIYQLILNQQQELENAKQVEKKRISRDLHDGIMGKLSGIRLNLYILKKKTDPETIAKCIEYVKEIQVIENDLRLLAHTLNKESVTTLNGIENEINNIFNDIKNHQNIDFVLQMDKKIIWEEVNYVLKLNLYRIIQEALHNIDKYAKAKQVTLTITQKEQGLSIEIKDDGIGFDATQKKEGIGLKNMRERAEESGGTFAIETAPKKGTIINLLLPF